MKKHFVVLAVLLLIPTLGKTQETGIPASPWKNIATVDANLAFGPSTTATWDPSLGCRIQISDHFRVGIGDLSFGAADLVSGTRYAIMAGPVAEYLAPISSEMTYSILAGIPVQNRWGAGIAHSLGIAPYGEAAIDYHFSPDFALAGNLRLQYIATDAYLRSPRVLPSSAFIIAFGVGFHFFF